MIRKSTYSIEQILPLIGTTEKIEIDGESVRINSLRLRNFKEHGIKCVSCGIEGRFFAAEKSHSHDKSYHLNLYALKNNKEILMTRDHIIASADHGPNILKNLQTMCAPCNQKKGSKNNSGNSQTQKIRINRMQPVLSQIKESIPTKCFRSLVRFINKTSCNSILTRRIDPIEPQMNLSKIDSYHNQFINLGNNCMIAAKIENEECSHFYIYNKITGERFQISFKNEL